MDYFPRKLLSKYLTYTIDFNKHVDDIDKWRKYVVVDMGDSSKLQDDLSFAFEQRESEVNLHKASSSPESPSNVSPGFLIYYEYFG